MPIQGQAVVPDEASCPDCVVNATVRLAFRTGEAPAGLVGPPVHIARDGQHRYWMTVPGELPLVFDRQGRFIREVGRRGGGPGEFQSAGRATALPGDSMLVLDGQQARASVFGPDLTFSRAITLPLYAGPVAVLSWPDSVILNGSSFSPPHAGWPLHLIDMSTGNADILRSFGENRVELRAGETALLSRHFIAVDRSSFWTAQVHRFRFTHYSRGGTVLSEIHRSADWFREVSRGSIGSPSIAPPPNVDVATLRGDTLWVAIRIARPDWQSAWAGIVIPPGGELRRNEAPDRTDLYMSRIEVIDLRAGRLIAHGSIKGLVTYLDETLHAIVYDVDFRGVPTLTLVALDLAKDPRKGEATHSAETNYELSGTAGCTQRSTGTREG